MLLGHFIRKASKNSVVEGFQHIKRYYIPNKRLISANSPLDRDGIGAIRRHSNNAIPYQISSNEFKTYLAASSLAHLLDGWMYLSNSFNSLLNGDKGTAIHLAYYAELRSAMSILATEGIGVFDKKHFGVFEYNHCEIFKYRGNQYKKGSTHQFVWNAMEKWSNSSYKPDVELLKIFKVRGRDFYELTEFFHPATAGSTFLTVQTVKSWLKEWCLDIRSYREDRENRNEVSYRPQRIKNFDQNIDFKAIITCLDGYWTAISPSATDKFSLLDTYLLRKLFRNIYVKIGSPGNYKDLVENAFNQYGIHDETLFSLLNFEPPFHDEHVLFEQAKVRHTTTLSIMARATILLRISVGLVSQLLRAGGIDKSSLDFVWDSYGIDNGFWTTGNLPVDFDLLWSDAQSSFSDLKSDLDLPGVDNSIYSIRQRNPKEIILLEQINRACLWGLDF